MTCATGREYDLPHTVFLRRVAAAPSGASSDARLGQGAFLALRLLDLLRPEARPVHADAFEYQRRATERLCHQLPVDETETAHLIGLVHSAADAFREHDVRLAVPALLAYGHYLEDQLHLEEALDVLESTLDVGAEQLGASDAVAVHLRMGRVNRKLNRFDDGDAQYALAAVLAESTGDVHSALLSRVGRAISTQARGNLAEAERLFRELSTDARAANERDIEARVHHALGTTLATRGELAGGTVHVWQSVQLYEDGSSALRALQDLGAMLLAMGRVDDAEHALSVVVRRGGARDNITNALIELMHCASYRRDRVGFERRRAECESLTDGMPPNILVDFYFKAGVGNARFGNFGKARSLMATALNIAGRNALREFEFRIERIMAGLRDCEDKVALKLDGAAEPAIRNNALEEVSASLANLG